MVPTERARDAKNAMKAAIFGEILSKVDMTNRLLNAIDALEVTLELQTNNAALDTFFHTCICTCIFFYQG